MAKGAKLSKVLEKLDVVCLTLDKCGTCNNSCVIKYSMEAADVSIKKHERVCEKGIENIPNCDTKIYDEEDLIDALVEILLQCKECDANHIKNCVINVIRASIERILISDNLDDYAGSALQHIMQISQTHPLIGEQILNKYAKEKKGRS